MWKAVKLTVDYLVNFVTFLAGCMALLMVVHVGADILCRFLFNLPIVGTAEIVPAYYMVALTYMPLAMLTRDREHMRVIFFTQNASWRAGKWFDLFSHIVMLGFVGLVLAASLRESLAKTLLGEAVESSLPSGYLATWPSRWMLVASFALMFIYVIVSIVEDVAKLISKSPHEEKAR
ncbi:MAG: TRAP transporter small permease [Sphingobium sp.]